MEIPIKMDDLGGTTIFGNIHIGWVSVSLLIFRVKEVGSANNVKMRPTSRWLCVVEIALEVTARDRLGR